MIYGAELVPVWPFVAIGSSFLLGLVVVVGVRLARKFLRV